MAPVISPPVLLDRLEVNIITDSSAEIKGA